MQSEDKQPLPFPPRAAPLSAKSRVLSEGNRDWLRVMPSLRRRTGSLLIAALITASEFRREQQQYSCTHGQCHVSVTAPLTGNSTTSGICRRPLKGIILATVVQLSHVSGKRKTNSTGKRYERLYERAHSNHQSNLTYYLMGGQHTLPSAVRRQTPKDAVVPCGHPGAEPVVAAPHNRPVQSHMVSSIGRRRA